jgi:hypothetical protein
MPEATHARHHGHFSKVPQTAPCQPLPPTASSVRGCVWTPALGPDAAPPVNEEVARWETLAAASAVEATKWRRLAELLEQADPELLKLLADPDLTSNAPDRPTASGVRKAAAMCDDDRLLWQRCAESRRRKEASRLPVRAN